MANSTQKYTCELCEYETTDKRNYKNHIASKKHVKKVEGKDNLYICNYCDYKTIYKYHYTKHLNSLKHANNCVAEKLNIQPNQCNQCFRQYSCKNSLSRHRRNCSAIVNQIDEKPAIIENNNANTNIINPELFITMMKNQNEIIVNQQQQQSNMTNILSTMVEKIGDTNSHNTNSSMNHSNNKTFNIQFFLNEQCKNAIDIKDFIKNLDYSSSNLENNCEKDFTERIIKQMKDGFHNYAVEERPIHCSDAKRNKLHIRDKGEWISGMDSQRKMHEIVANMDFHIQNSFRKWVFENPSCLVLDTPAYNKYMKIYPSINGPTSDALEDRCIKKVVTGITDEVVIDKDKFAL